MDDDLTWMSGPPTITNPEEAKAAEEIIRREHSVPRGRKNAEELRKADREEISPSPNRLSDELAWYVPGLAYCLMGLDRSVFALFSADLGRDVKVVSHQAKEPLIELDFEDAKEQPWFGIVQGIPREFSEAFKEYIESFLFREQTPKGEVQWALTIHQLRIADPFYTDDEGMFRGHTVQLLLPRCLTNKAEVAVCGRDGFSLRLSRPVLGVRWAQ